MLKPTVRVLFTEPEAYDQSLRAHVPSDWKCTFKSFAGEMELVKWVTVNDYHIVFGRLGLALSSSFFRANSSIKIVATPTTGLDHIDLKAAENAGVRVLSLRGELELLRQITSTAEHAWALLLACNRRIPSLVHQTRAGSWARGSLELHQISRHTIGIIGFGRLGRMVADYARAFRMHVIACDPYVSKDQIPFDVEHASLGDLLSKSDHTVLTAAYSAGDPEILGREQVLSMKFGSTFINVSRGELVNEAALVEALDLGIIRAVGIDVLSGDSRWACGEQVESPLIEKSRKTDRVLVTPHVGGYALEAVKETRLFMVQRVNQVIKEELGMTP
jgi:D-3-phosphoglycerate dehydrogenase / 2-oxoglutarate reductase